MSEAKNILIISGEHSGDRLGADLIRACKQHHPKWQFIAMGGQPIRNAGADILIPNDDLAIIGFVEVIKHFKKLRAIFKKIKKFIIEDRPDLIILIDYPGFNLKVAKFAQENGCKVLYYTSPQIWAWKAGRIKRIKRDIDHMAVLFPFEEAIYQQAGVPVTVVGHPMLQRFATPIEKIAARQQLNIHEKETVLAILPGSRVGEVNRLMPVIIESCSQLIKAIPDLKILIALADTIPQFTIPNDLKSNITLITGKTDFVVATSDATICASGTATLEVALAVKPLVIIYKTSFITFALAKCFMKIPYIGLCNIIAKKLVAKELIQEKLTAEALTREASQLLQDATYRNKITNDLEKTRSYLGNRYDVNPLITVIADLLSTHP